MRTLGEFLGMDSAYSTQSMVRVPSMTCLSMVTVLG